MARSTQNKDNQSPASLAAPAPASSKKKGRPKKNKVRAPSTQNKENQPAPSLVAPPAPATSLAAPPAPAASLAAPPAPTSTKKKGRSKGSPNWKKEEKTLLLELCQEHLPIGANDWDNVAVLFEEEASKHTWNRGLREGNLVLHLHSRALLSSPAFLLACWQYRKQSRKQQHMALKGLQYDHTTCPRLTT